MKPSKYQYLAEAEALGIKVPKSLFLSEEALAGQEVESLLNKFIDQNKEAEFIVRSCVAAEDGTETSMAGHFYSSDPLQAHELGSMVQHAFSKNKAIAKNLETTGALNLMVQPYVRASLGGVMFSQWKYFSHHFLGEVTDGGAEKTVSGQESQFFLLGKSRGFPDLITVKNLPAEKLTEAVVKLESHFDFPLDIEWLFDGKNITVVQIRPMTRSLQALRPAAAAEAEKATMTFQKTALGTWEIESLAESFGELSPLSFSVLSSCYENSLDTFRDLGFKAECFNFLARAGNGQTYANPRAYKDFYALEAWHTPFWQSVKEPAFKVQVHTYYKSYDVQNESSLERLQGIFNHWQIANFYAHRDASKNSLEALTWPEEYEVLKLLNLKFPPLKDKMHWSDWRNTYKQWWLFEYEKLKQLVVKKPILALSTIENLNLARALKSYETELPLSIIDYPTVFGEPPKGSNCLSVVKGALNKASVLVIKNPKTWRGSFPKSCVLVAPYFDNAWVTQIENFKGIVLEQGGTLSHSAIVAREKNIPYRIHWTNATTAFETGDFINE